MSDDHPRTIVQLKVPVTVQFLAYLETRYKNVPQHVVKIIIDYEKIHPFTKFKENPDVLMYEIMNLRKELEGFQNTEQDVDPGKAVLKDDWGEQG